MDWSAGCHVLLEKPFALSLAEADEMIARAEENKKVLMVGFPNRYRKSTRKFKELIDSGAFGRLFMLDAMMDEDHREYVTGWITKKATLGGGVFFSASPHMLDVMLWIAGEVQTISMVGTQGGLEMEGEDTALAVIRFKSGVVGSTRHTWFSPRRGDWRVRRMRFCLTHQRVGTLQERSVISSIVLKQENPAKPMARRLGSFWQ